MEGVAEREIFWGAGFCGTQQDLVGQGIFGTLSVTISQ